MLSRETFVDSNILIYAHDKAEHKKQPIAEKIIKEFWEEDIFPSISIQVLQEFFVNLKRKNLNSLAVSQITTSYLEWNVIASDKNLLKQAIHIYNAHQLSLWDCNIIAAAQKAKAKFILSEDFQHNRNYEGIQIINPFL